MRCPKCGGRHLVNTDYRDWYMIAFFILISTFWNPYSGLVAFLSVFAGNKLKNKMECLDCGTVAKPQNAIQSGISKMNRY